ncbi:hypothetical protein B0H14DRAFT_3505382 [Mycena olivaceomarginata]|nr:hypothetical protein B0H14DRAFT_3505382 [Mycena olivaceomarginata]
MGNRLISEASAFTVSTLSYGTFFRLGVILLLMMVSSLMPTANLDVMACDDIHVMTKPMADFNLQ